MKVVVIGGGSTYTPELVAGFVDKGDRLGLSEVCLHDIDRPRLDVVSRFCRRLVAARGSAFTLSTTGNLVEAVKGADFVIIQIRVGGNQARHEDICLGLRHGLIGQETTGIGGFAKALRTVPVVMNICRTVEEHAPGSWILNFTNPSGLVTEAILTHSPLKAIGLCNIPMDVKMSISAETGIAPGRIRLDYIGLNHLAWLRRVLVDDRDIMPDIMDKILQHGTPKNIPDFDYEPDVLQTLGMIPMYYLRYYYYTGKMLALLKAKTKSRAQEVLELEHQLLSLYADENLTEKPELLEKRGGAYYSLVAVDLIEALRNEAPTEHIVNVANGNTLDALPPGAVIECPTAVSASGTTPLPAAPLDAKIRGLVQTVKAYEELTVRAAVFEDYNAAFWALATHPLGPSAEKATEFLDDLITVNRLEYLRRR